MVLLSLYRAPVYSLKILLESLGKATVILEPFGVQGKPV
jgi:hypothetical protein